MMTHLRRPDTNCKSSRNGFLIHRRLTDYTSELTKFGAPRPRSTGCQDRSDGQRRHNLIFFYRSALVRASAPQELEPRAGRLRMRSSQARGATGNWLPWLLRRGQACNEASGTPAHQADEYVRQLRCSFTTFDDLDARRLRTLRHRGARSQARNCGGFGRREASNPAAVLSVAASHAA
jgi:hypothetical protein